MLIQALEGPHKASQRKGRLFPAPQPSRTQSAADGSQRENPGGAQPPARLSGALAAGFCSYSLPGRCLLAPPSRGCVFTSTGPGNAERSRQGTTGTHSTPWNSSRQEGRLVKRLQRVEPRCARTPPTPATASPARLLHGHASEAVASLSHRP